jgi:hypothetical protein
MSGENLVFMHWVLCVSRGATQPREPGLELGKAVAASVQQTFLIQDLHLLIPVLNEAGMFKNTYGQERGGPL